MWTNGTMRGNRSWVSPTTQPQMFITPNWPESLAATESKSTTNFNNTCNNFNLQNNVILDWYQQEVLKKVIKPTTGYTYIAKKGAEL